VTTLKKRVEKKDESKYPNSWFSGDLRVKGRPGAKIVPRVRSMTKNRKNERPLSHRVGRERLSESFPTGQLSFLASILKCPRGWFNFEETDGLGGRGKERPKEIVLPKKISGRESGSVSLGLVMNSTKGVGKGGG